jgi:hypothetical protein
MTGKVEIAMDKMEEIRKAAMNFKDSIAGQLRDLNVDIKDWRFGMESHEEGVTIDVTVKILLKPKPKK